LFITILPHRLPQEYLHYLRGFADRHGLLPQIHLSCGVQEVRKCPETGKWLVSILPGRPYGGSERCVGVVEDDLALPSVQAFDAIAVCTGTNNYSALPHFEGQEDFQGKIVHSESYKDAEAFRGKRVLVVGAGESGEDNGCYTLHTAV
jgi:dimethylaniline monooxygenase (N-oxide forming)